MRSLRVAYLLGAIALGAPHDLVGQEARFERDVVYGHVDGMATVYDVGIPPITNRAGVVFVISGGFLSTRQQQEMIAPVAEPLLRAGFTVFYLRHPSTPRYMAPEIYETIRTGVGHVLEHASDFGVDPSRVGIMGMSTGGMLALLLATDVPTDADSARGERLAAVAAYMPMADMRENVGNVRATPSLGFSPDLAPTLSPVDFVTADDPPTLLLHGGRDTVVPIEPNSVRLLGLFEAEGVPTELLVVDHGHELFRAQEKERADRAVVDWFERYLVD